VVTFHWHVLLYFVLLYFASVWGFRLNFRSGQVTRMKLQRLNGKEKVARWVNNTDAMWSLVLDENELC
jgi:hypothetical protein